MSECKAVVMVMLIMFASVQYRPIMLGELSTNGNFSALLVHQIAKAWKLKLNAQVNGACNLCVWITAVMTNNHNCASV